jgi:adenine-specific DNA-methyltransferase
MENKNAMKKVTLEEGGSLDIMKENLEALKSIFPEAFTEDGVDFDTLRQLLGDEIDEGEEKYGLNWHGKKRARQIALTPSAGTLRPCPKESVDWDTTQNLFIEGDNLEVLKLLQKSYAGKVKMIYIDPPYNTGKDFIYPDQYQDNLQTYLKYTNQRDDDGFKNSSNTEGTGRFHTNWLRMMYPRIRLAKNLLHQEGIFVASIDDTEMPNLRSLLDEIFGPENFLGAFIWNGGRKNDAKRISIGHDYMLVYARNEAILKEKDVRWRERKDGLNDVYTKAEELRQQYGNDYTAASKELKDWYKSLPEGNVAKEHSHYKKLDAKGVWYGDNISSPNYRANLIFDWKGYKPPKNGWRYNKSAMERLDDEGLLIYPESMDKRIQYKRYLHQTEEWAPASVFYKDRRAASKSLTNLMGENIFDFPKDVGVVARFIKVLTEESDIVLDFFAGSGTTGHSVMVQNVDENTTRRFILIQLPEPLDPLNKNQKASADYCEKINKPKNIAELTKERLRHSIARIKHENADYTGDLGFKAFKLDSSNIRAWTPDRNDLEQTLLDHTEHLVEDRTEEDVLYELLLKRGVDLTVPIKQKDISGKAVYSIGYGVLFACLNETISRDEVEVLAQGIIDWHKELEPASDTQVVFRDSAFADDIAKTNMTAILEQNGITHVRSL